MKTMRAFEEEEDEDGDEERGPVLNFVARVSTTFDELLLLLLLKNFVLVAVIPNFPVILGLTNKLSRM